MDIIKKFEPLFGEWHAESLIGAGSYGRVYKAYREEFGDRYYSAIKYISIPPDDHEVVSLRDDGMDDESITTYYTALAKDFASETRLMNKIKGYSNIVSYEDSRVVPKADGFGYDIFIRMELLESLSERARKTALSQDDVVSLGIDICTALEVCGEHGIIHRDIKPDNIFVNTHGDYKLGDFGIARQLDKTATFMSKKGTYNYMAPEVYKGEKYGVTCDIYSLGLVMYRLLNNNRLPFLPPAPKPITPADKEKALIDRLNGKPMAAPCNADEQVAEIVRKACAYAPKDRYSSPKQMKEELLLIKYGFVRRPETLDCEAKPEVASFFSEPEKEHTIDSTSSMFGTMEAEQTAEDIAATLDERTQSVFDRTIVDIPLFENRNKPDGVIPLPQFEQEMEPDSNERMTPTAFSSGETILFGSYYQDEGKKPIEWYVLTKNESKALLLSKYALDCQPYDKENTVVRWSSSYLREWLNTVFLNNAFSNLEKCSILYKPVSFDGNSFTDSLTDDDSFDKVFLLSGSEVVRFLPSARDMQCKPTEYAKSRGARSNEEKGCCWWLRSPGENKNRAVYVYYDGTEAKCGANYSFIAVRPAIMLDLK